MTLHLRPEIATGLSAIAASRGLSVEDYLQQIVERELPANRQESESSEASGMVWEDGLLVYGAGTPLPDHVIDDAIRRSRDERSNHILGNIS